MVTDQAGERRTIEAEGFPPMGPASTAAPRSPDVVSVGEGSPDAIPRAWAERILGSLRANRPGIWKTELGKASTGGG